MANARELSSPARQIAALLERIDDGQFRAPTPCTDFTVRDLLAHLLTLAFRHAAAKAVIGDREAPVEDGTAMDDWRTRLPAQLDGLVAAWRDPAAWDGTTEVGGITLPGAMAGGFARNELIVHGWDLAKATGQGFHCDPVVAEAALGFTAEAVAQGFGEAYGPAVKISGDAPVLDRLLGMTGRDPSWTRPAAHTGPPGR